METGSSTAVVVLPEIGRSRQEQKHSNVLHQIRKPLLDQGHEKLDERVLQRQNRMAMNLEQSLDKILLQWKENRALSKIKLEATELAEGSAADSTKADKRWTHHNGLYNDLTVLEEKILETRVWDSIFQQVISNQDICTSTPMAVLLDRIRNHYLSFLGSFEHVFTEVKRRLKFDWLLETLKVKKDTIGQLTVDRIKDLQEQLTEEMRISSDYEQDLTHVRKHLEDVKKKWFQPEDLPISHVFDPNTGILKPFSGG